MTQPGSRQSRDSNQIAPLRVRALSRCADLGGSQTATQGVAGGTTERTDWKVFVRCLKVEVFTCEKHYGMAST